MINSHPLTDEICYQIQWVNPDGLGEYPCEPQDMRAAADWQLQQVIEWITKNAMKHDSYQRFLYFHDPDCSTKTLAKELACDLREAMRPTAPTQEDN